MLRLPALAALVAVAAGGWTWAQAAPPDAGAAVATASPEQAKVTVRVGEPVTFSVDRGAAGATVRWRLDGSTVDAGPTWTFEPGTADIGRHVVTVAVAGLPATPTMRRRWDVRVRPPRLPRVTAREPAEDTVSVEVGREVVLRFVAQPAAPGETVRTIWTVDGAPAGEGDTLRWSAPEEPAEVRVRALAVGSLGAAVGQEWRIEVRPPPTTTTTGTTTTTTPPTTTTTTTTRPPTTTTTEPPPPPTTTTSLPPEADRGAIPPAREPERPPATTAPPAPPPPPPPPPPPASRGRATPAPGGSMESDVRRLLDRYAAAWRSHDVAELRRIGQVTSDDQAADLERYFAKIGDLDVEVEVVEIRPEGNAATVRFTRRDRFRDPTGRVITKELPTIEKRVVQGADGLRFAPGGR